MVATTVHLMRHGEVHNPEGVLYGRLPGYRLSERGQEMARVVAAHLSDENAHDIVQPAVALVVTEVEHGSHNLTSAGWVGSPVSMPLEHNRRAVLRLDDRAKIGPEQPGRALPAWVVGATKPTPD